MKLPLKGKEKMYTVTQILADTFTPYEAHTDTLFGANKNSPFETDAHTPILQKSQCVDDTNNLNIAIIPSTLRATEVSN